MWYGTRVMMRMLRCAAKHGDLPTFPDASIPALSVEPDVESSHE
jgi:hypothetical protein